MKSGIGTVGPTTATPAPGGRRFPWKRLLLALLGLVLLCAPYQLQTPRLVSLGTDNVGKALRGFSFVELDASGVAYRWSEAEAVVHFEGVGNAPVRLRLLLHARRPSGAAVVHVLANGLEVAVVEAGGDFAEHVIVVPRGAVGWSGAVDITLRVEPFTAPPDTRSLGAAVASLCLEGAGWPVLPPLAVLLPLTLAVVGVACWPYPRARLRGRDSGAGVVALLGCLAASAAMRAGWASAGAWLWSLPVVAWLVALAGWCGAAFGRAWQRLAAWSRRRSRRFWVGAMIVAALSVYVPLSWTTGYWGDIEIYMAWTHQVTHHGIHSAYSPDFVAPPNTTPVLLYPFWLAGEVFRRVWSPDFPPPWEVRENQQYLRFLLRLPALFATAAIVVVLHRYVKHKWRENEPNPAGDGREGRSLPRAEAVALLAAAAYLFNPAVIFESAYYGQMGAVHTLFILLAVIAIVEGRPAMGWAALTVGMLTKPQADVFVPLLLLLTWRWYRWKGLLRSGLTSLGVVVLVLAPFLYYGTLGQMWERVSRVTSYHPILSATAHNLWWLVSLGEGKASDLGTLPFLAGLGFGFINYRVIGLALFGLAYLLVLVVVWRRPYAPDPITAAGIRQPGGSASGEVSEWGEVYAACAYLFVAFFILPTQIHENHLIPMFPLLLLAAVAAWRRGSRMHRRLYVLYAVTTTVNMALHYPQILRVLVPSNPDIWGGSELAGPRLLDSVVQVGAFVWWTAVLARRTRARREPVGAGMPTAPAGR